MNTDEFSDSQIMRLNAPLSEAAERSCQHSDERSADPATAVADERSDCFERLHNELTELSASVNADSSTREDYVPLQLDHPWEIPAYEVRFPMDWEADSREDDESVESFGKVHPERDDRLTRTIKQITGWTVLKPSYEDGSSFCLVFSDSEKRYAFTLWRIDITFHRQPGIAFVDWSPETLEGDLKRAMAVTLSENVDRSQLADPPAENLSPDQLTEMEQRPRKRSG